MADLATLFTLATPGGTVLFNNGSLGDGTDKYWVQEISGLDGAAIRAPVDNVPYGDGGIVHNFWKGPRHVVFEGVLMIETVSLNQCRSVRNSMENSLIVALKSILRANGTLSWTPLGLGARSLTVRIEVPVEFRPIENYTLDSFVFGLVAANPVW